MLSMKAGTVPRQLLASRSILTVLSSYLLGTSLARPVRFGGQLTLSLLSFLRRSSRVRLLNVPRERTVSIEQPYHS